VCVKSWEKVKQLTHHRILQCVLPQSSLSSISVLPPLLGCLTRKEGSSVSLVTEMISPGRPFSFLVFVTDIVVVTGGPCLDFGCVIIAVSTAGDMVGCFSLKNERETRLYL